MSDIICGRGVSGVLVDGRCAQARSVPAQVRHVVEHAGLYFVRPADPPSRPDEALLFLGDDAVGLTIEVVGVELADGRLRIIHAMPMRATYRELYEEAMRLWA